MTTDNYTHYNSLRAAVLAWASDACISYDDPSGPYRDLSYGGCESGMVPELIYTVDCHQFYTDHADEIEELVEQFEEETGQPLRSDTYDRRTFFAWFAFEETARRIASENGWDD